MYSEEVICSTADPCAKTKQNAVIWFCWEQTVPQEIMQHSIHNPFTQLWKIFFLSKFSAPWLLVMFYILNNFEDSFWKCLFRTLALFTEAKEGPPIYWMQGPETLAQWVCWYLRPKTQLNFHPAPSLTSSCESTGVWRLLSLIFSHSGNEQCLMCPGTGPHAPPTTKEPIGIITMHFGSFLVILLV